MQSIVNVYFLSFYGCFLAAAGRLDISQETLQSAFAKKQTINEQSNKFTLFENNLNMLQVIRKIGYSAEAHVIQTEDGYLLTLYRIRGNKAQPPVLLQHGLLSSSADWVIAGKDKGLAFILADQGYDVWMGNFRGNTYSKEHVSLSSSDSKFWNFSFHEMGIYDLPAMISYITNTTSQPLYTYIGHSMGTTASYVMAAKRPEITRMVRMIISLAPAVFLKHMRNPIRYLTPFAEKLQVMLHLFGKEDLLSRNIMVHYLKKIICTMTRTQKEICTNLLLLVVGFNKERFNMDLLPAILNYYPAGASVKTVVHYAQIYNSDKFCQYDYGRVRNLQIYKASKPPDYNLANVTTPFALFYAENDLVSNISDVKRLISILPNVIYEYEVPKFNHLDFIWNIDAPQLVYERLLNVMKLQTNNAVS